MNFTKDNFNSKFNYANKNNFSISPNKARAAPNKFEQGKFQFKISKIKIY